jgi:hypothetical protein
VPRDLRESAKRTPAVKDWVRTLEEPVRQFMRDQHALLTGSSASTIAVEDDSGEMDSDEEEIVFAGRSDAVRELREKRDRWRLAQREMVREVADSGVVFDSFGEDESASFKYVSFLGYLFCNVANDGCFLQAVVDALYFGLLRSCVTICHGW